MSLDNPRSLAELGVLLGPAFANGNRIRALLNGDETFPPMPAAICSANVSITFETYVYWSGDIGRKFGGLSAVGFGYVRHQPCWLWVMRSQYLRICTGRSSGHKPQRRLPGTA